MEPAFSNYEMFDKLIANNKKAHSWTIFWITVLCIFAGTVIWMAYDISAKKKTIAQQKLALQTQEEFLEVKNQLIDSLVANCNTAKTEIIDQCDSILSITQSAINKAMDAKPVPGSSGSFSRYQKIKLEEADESIHYIKNNLYTVKRDFRNETVRLFIQYNNKEERSLINKLSAKLKNNNHYYVAPAEFIDNSFATIIKFYNYKNEGDEKELIALVAKQFRIDPDRIKVKHETNKKIKPTIEIWIGSENGR